MPFFTAVRGALSASVLGLALAAPAQAGTAEWEAALAEPGRTARAGLIGPAALQSWSDRVFDPAMVNAMTASLADQMDPGLFLRWMQAALDPAMIDATLAYAPPKAAAPMVQALFAPGMFDTLLAFASPDKKEVLIHTLLNPAIWDAVIASEDPRLMAGLMKAAFDPGMIGPALHVADPAHIAGCLERMSDPAFMQTLSQMSETDLARRMMTAMVHMSIALPAAGHRATEL